VWPRSIRSWRWWASSSGFRPDGKSVTRRRVVNGYLPRVQFAGPRTLLAVHAHPGDESCATGGVLAHYASQGVRVVVVTCTSGELGDAPGGARPGELGHHPELVAAHRRAELVAACEVLGVTDLELLGYHDSGVTGEVPPGAFCAVPVETAAGRVAALIEHYHGKDVWQGYQQWEQE